MERCKTVPETSVQMLRFKDAQEEKQFGEETIMDVPMVSLCASTRLAGRRLLIELKGVSKNVAFVLFLE